MSDDGVLERLRAAGFDLSLFTAEQLELLTALSEEEVAVLIEVRERLGEVQPDVLVHQDTSLTLGGMMF